MTIKDALAIAAVAALLLAGCRTQEKKHKATFEGPESKTEIEVKTTDKDPD